MADGSSRRDEEKLAELGYKQELDRAWSSFSNFAISFTIISVLAGCFTTYGQAFNNGGPVAISWGWPIISALILLVAFSMSELVAAYPTAGGPYWWAAKLGGPGWSWFTGWFNVIGLVAVVASVDYAAAVFGSALFNLWGLDIGVVNFADSVTLSETFVVFAVILLLHAAINIYSSHLVALFNNISVFWHVTGVAVIIAILVFVPDDHQSADFVFTETLNNSGFSDGSTGGGFFWFYVLPLGFLLTMYTITGYDASAHVSEETHEAERSAARGIWQSVFYSAVIGWFVLLAITFAAVDVEAASGGSIAIFTSAMSEGWAEIVILISFLGQLFCGMACVTSCSRTFYAFSRDRAVPGWKVWSGVNKNRVPVAAVLGVCLFALIITIPALWGTDGIPVAFFAVVSVAVIALYIAYVIPVYLRLRAGDDFTPGVWTLGKKYKWVNTGAVIWVAICTVIFSLPFTPAAVPWNDEFDWSALNYAPLMVFGVILVVGVWWLVSAKDSYKGPVRTIGFDEGMGITEEEPTEPPPAEPARP